MRHEKWLVKRVQTRTMTGQNTQIEWTNEKWLDKSLEIHKGTNDLGHGGWLDNQMWAGRASGHANVKTMDDGLWTWLVTGQTRTYLGCLLCLQFPDQLTLLGHSGEWTGGGVWWRCGWCWSWGGRGHTWLVVHTCLLFKLSLHEKEKEKRERKRKKEKERERKRKKEKERERKRKKEKSGY